MTTRPLLALTVFTALTACAGRQEVATLAAQSSAVLNEYKREMSSFARQQTSLTQDNARRMSDFKQARDRQQMALDSRLRQWRFIDAKEALAIYAEAAKDGGEQILSGSEMLRSTSAPANQVAAVRFDAGQVEGLIKKLKALEKSPTFWDNFAFALSYNDALKAAYAKSLQEAAKGSGEAGVQGEIATETIVPAMPLTAPQPNSGGQ